MRIVSVVPSLTELLYDLGLEEEVVGITKFCIHPESWFRTKTSVGGTKTLNLETIRQLQPDLIIANKEENTKEQVETLAKEFKVHITDISNLDEALQAIIDIGSLTGKESKAMSLVNKIREQFTSLKPLSKPLNTAYLIWRNPYMTIGGDTFINDLLKRCGLRNVFQSKTRYPETTLEELKDSKVEVILLSSEPYPFKEKHIQEIQDTLPGVRVSLVDGEMFSWYGSRLQYAPAYFNKLLSQL